MNDSCVCKKLVSNPIHVGTSYHINAHGMIITKKFEHCSCRSFESKPTLRKKRGLRWKRKPPFPCLITLLCASKAHHCHFKFSNLFLACWISLSIIKYFSKASVYSFTFDNSLFKCITYIFLHVCFLGSLKLLRFEIF